MALKIYATYNNEKKKPSQRRGRKKKKMITKIVRVGKKKHASIQCVNLAHYTPSNAPATNVRLSFVMHDLILKFSHLKNKIFCLEMRKLIVLQCFYRSEKVYDFSIIKTELNLV